MARGRARAACARTRIPNRRVYVPLRCRCASRCLDAPRAAHARRRLDAQHARRSARTGRGRGGAGRRGPDGVLGGDEAPCSCRKPSSCPGVLVSQARVASKAILTVLAADSCQRRARVASKARLHVRDGGARGVHDMRRARHEACTTVHAMPARFRWLRTAARKTAVRIGCGRLVAPSVACVGIPRLPTRVGSLLVLGVPAARCVTARTREARSLLVPAIAPPRPRERRDGSFITHGPEKRAASSSPREARTARRCEGLKRRDASDGVPAARCVAIRTRAAMQALDATAATPAALR